MSAFVDLPFDKPVMGPEQKVDETAFFLTNSQSRITKNGRFVGLKKIQVTGKSIIEHNTTLRGDLAKITIGYYVIVGEGTILKPAEKFGEQLSFINMSIGDYTAIGRNCVIRAWQIGCCCWIGDGSVINNRCVVEDCAMVLPNSVLAPGTIVPPYIVFAGNPAKPVGRLPPTFDMIMNEHTHAFYKQFTPVKTSAPIGAIHHRSARRPTAQPSSGDGRHRSASHQRQHRSNRHIERTPQTDPKSGASKPGS